MEEKPRKQRYTKSEIKFFNCKGMLYTENKLNLHLIVEFNIHGKSYKTKWLRLLTFVEYYCLLYFLVL